MRYTAAVLLFLSLTVPAWAGEPRSAHAPANAAAFLAQIDAAEPAPFDLAARECTPKSKCCKVCTTKSKACGDSCISKDKVCHQARGCACNTADVC